MVGKTNSESDRGEDGITSVQSQSDLKFIFNSLILLAMSHFPDVTVFNPQSNHYHDLENERLENIAELDLNCEE